MQHIGSLVVTTEAVPEVVLALMVAADLAVATSVPPAPAAPKEAAEWLGILSST